MSSTEIATLKEYNVLTKLGKVKYLNELIKEQAPFIMRTLPDRDKINKFLNGLELTFSLASSKVLECTPYSIFTSCLQLAYFGLDPSPYTGHGYLVPFKKIATLIIGYKGYVYLMLRSGVFSAVNAEVVYENDIFNLELGLNRNLSHIPVAPSKQGGIIGSYSTYVHKDGFKGFCWMWLEEIEKIRDKSPGYAYAKSKGYDTPWLTNPGEMYKKTPTRRMIKLAQFPVGDDRFRIASEIDGAQEGGKDLLKQELKVGAIKDGDGNWLEPDPETTNNNEVTIVDAEVTDVEPTKPRPDNEKKTAVGLDKVTPEVQTGKSTLDGLVEKIISGFGVDLADLYGWFKDQKITTEMGRISKIEQAIELLDTGIPWSTISAKKATKTKKTKSAEPTPPKENKASPKENPPAEKEVLGSARDRVIALVGSNRVLRDELLKRIKGIFPTLNAEIFLNLEYLPKPGCVPDSHIKKMDECFQENKLYE